MAKENKIQTCVEIAKLYYKQGKTQDYIAKKLGLSRPSVSRMLQMAIDKGIVQIKIVDPHTDHENIEHQLESKYNLKRAYIAYAKEDNSNAILNAIASEAATYLNDNIHDGDTLGVCWGDTLYSIAKLVHSRMVKGVQIVQLKGGVTQTTYQTHAKEIVDIFAQKFNAIGFYHPLPTIFASVKVKRLVEQDPYSNSILELANKANIALFTVGYLGEDALLLKLGYFSNAEKRDIIANAKGDILSHILKEDGSIFSPAINNRTNSIDLEELKKKDQRILVAGGKNKIQAMKAALNGGYPNILITDQYTALELL